MAIQVHAATHAKAHMNQKFNGDPRLELACDGSNPAMMISVPEVRLAIRRNAPLR
jgi:hypothetical protein